MTANPESNATICVDLGGTKILTALISDGEILDRDEKPTRSDETPDEWIAAEAARREKDGDAASVFAAAAEQNGWAESIVSESARRAALLCQNIQMTFDPEFIVIGGGVGLANGYLDRMTNYCAKMSAFHRPNLVPAALGKDAGIIGLADLTIKNRRPPTGRK